MKNTTKTKRAQSADYGEESYGLIALGTAATLASSGNTGATASTSTTASAAAGNVGMGGGMIPPTAVSNPQTLPFASQAPRSTAPSTSVFANTKEQTNMLASCKDIVADVLSNFESGNIAYNEALLIACLNYLASSTQSSFDHKYYYVSLAYLCKVRPQVFSTEAIIEKMIQILRIAPSSQLISTTATRKAASLTRVLLVCILMRLYADAPQWSLDFIKAFIDDSLGERLWVDADTEQCKLFVSNILNAFQSMQPSENASGTSNRFPTSDMNEIYEYTLNQLNAAISQTKAPKKRGIEASIIKVCMLCANIPEVRLLASKNLDSWLSQNPMQANQVASQQAPVIKLAKDLLNRMVGYMLVSYNPLDQETFKNILAMKLKTALSTYYIETIVKLVANEQYQMLALHHFLINECQVQAQRIGATTSFINYFKAFCQVFQAIPEHASLKLAYVLMDMAASEQFQPHLRPLVRRIVKSLIASGLNFVELCVGLLSHSQSMTQQPLMIREKWVHCLIDLVCTVCITCKICQTKEVSTDINEQISIVNSKCIEWCLNALPQYLPELSLAQYESYIRHLLFLEPLTSYPATDNLVESEKIQIQVLSYELPVQEATIINLQNICLHLGQQMNEPTLAILESILHRAASYSLLTRKNGLLLQHENAEYVIRELFRVTLPDVEYTSPEGRAIYIRHMFWKACLILYILIAFNPSAFANIVMGIPTMKCLIEYTIKNQLPELEMMHEGGSYLEQEQQLITLYCQEIHERYQPNNELFQNGPYDPRLLQYFMALHLSNDTRFPPAAILQQFIKLDKELRIGHELRNSREPDFLTDIMRREGSQQSLTWLIRIIHNDINTLSILPVPILCELFLVSINKRDKANEEMVVRMTVRLCEWLFNSIVDNSFQVLSFFLSKLSDQSESSRRVAKQCLKRLLSQDDIYCIDMDTDMGATGSQKSKYGVTTEEYSWIDKISTLKCWSQCKEILWNAYAHLCQYDTDIAFISTYTEFLYANNVKDALPISLVLSGVLTNRKYLSREMFSSIPNSTQFHLLVQKIFEVAFLHLTGIQAMLANSPEGSKYVLVRLSDGSSMRIPIIFLDGIVSFVSIPTNIIAGHSRQLFTDSMINIINLIVNVNSKLVNLDTHTEQTILDDSLAKRLLQTNNPIFIQKGLTAASLDGMLQALCSFGISKYNAAIISNEIIRNYINNNKEKEQLVREHLKKLPSFRVTQLLNCLEEYEDNRLKDFVKQVTAQSLGEPVEQEEVMDVEMKESSHISLDKVSWLDTDASRIKNVVQSSLSRENQDNSLSSLLGFLISGVDAMQHMRSDTDTKYLTLAIQFANAIKALLQQFGEILSQSSFGLAIIATLLLMKDNLNSDNAQAQQFKQLSSDIIRSICSNLASKHTADSNAYSYILTVHDRAYERRLDTVTQSLLQNSYQTDIIPTALNYLIENIRNQVLSQSDNAVANYLPALIKRGSAVAEEIVAQWCRGMVTDQPTNLLSIFHQNYDQRDLISRVCSQGMFIDLLMRLDPCVDMPNNRDIVLLSKEQTDPNKYLASLLVNLMIQNQDFTQLITSFEYATNKIDKQNGVEFAVMQFIKMLIQYKVKDTRFPILILQCTLNLLDRKEYTLSSILNNEEYNSYLESLLGIISENQQQFNDCVRFLLNRINEDPSTDNAKQLLLWLYTCYPDKVIKLIDLRYHEIIFSNLVMQPDFCSHLSTHLDKMMHRICKIILNQTGIQQKDSHVPQFGYALMRQTAFTHPFIVLRYLNSICALLEMDTTGHSKQQQQEQKTVNTSTIVTDDSVELHPNVLPTYLQVLGILDALRSHIFKYSCNIRPTLNQILIKYFNLLKIVAPTQRDTFLQLVNRFADFMCYYTFHLANDKEQHDEQNFLSTAKFLTNQSKVLKHLQNIYMEVHKIKLVLFNIEQLSSIKTLDSVSQDNYMILVNNENATMEIGIADYDITLLKSQLRATDFQLRQALNYLDSISQYSPIILNEMITPLMDLCSTESPDDYNMDEIITTSYHLIIRCLQFDSKKIYKQIIPLYLKNFMHENRQVRLYAIRFAFDIFPFCNEYMSDLLARLFYGQEKAESMTALVETIRMYIKV